MMKKLLLATVCSFSLIPCAYATDSCQNILPQVALHLTAEQWVATQTAKVTIAFDALLNKDQLLKAQDNFQTALKRVAAEGVWHITEFSRSPSKANLEQLHAVAEARLPEHALAGIRNRVQAMSSEGQSYVVQDIIYTPSVEEISAAQAKLRQQIYDQTKAELDRLNAVYPKANYELYNISFMSPPVPGPNIMMMSKTAVVAAGAVQGTTTNMSVSQSITTDAMVVLAAPPGNLCK